jgi:hypothetical protein
MSDLTFRAEARLVSRTVPPGNARHRDEDVQ